MRQRYSGFREKYKYIQDKRMYWELLKMEIRCFNISFAKGKAKETRNRELVIKEEMDRLDHIICSNSDITSLDEELKQYDSLKKELQQIYKNKGEAAKFRSKCMWTEKGERPTKYFFNLEKRNYSRKVISELEDDEGEITKEEEQIFLK